MIGGDERIRTADPLVANEVLSQLSYIPTKNNRQDREIGNQEGHAAMPGATHCNSDPRTVKTTRAYARLHHGSGPIRVARDGTLHQSLHEPAYRIP